MSVLGQSRGFYGSQAGPFGDVVFPSSSLTGLFNDGLGYSAINAAPSALSTFLGITVAEFIGTNALVMRFMKGVSRNRPSTYITRVFL